MDRCCKCLKMKSPLHPHRDDLVCGGCKAWFDKFAEMAANKRRQTAERGANADKPAPRPHGANKRTPKGGGGRLPDGEKPDIGPLTQPDRTEGKKWFAVSVYGGDRKARRRIAELLRERCGDGVGRVLVPRQEQEVVVGGKVVKQYRRAMPGYLLVRIEEGLLHELKRLPHVGSVLPYHEQVNVDALERLERKGESPPKPVPVPDEQVAKYLKRTRAENVLPSLGETVVVRAGTWKGVSGTVTDIVDAKDVVIVVLVIGVETEITEPATNVARAG